MAGDAAAAQRGIDPDAVRAAIAEIENR